MTPRVLLLVFVVVFVRLVGGAHGVRKSSHRASTGSYNETCVPAANPPDCDPTQFLECKDLYLCQCVQNYTYNPGSDVCLAPLDLACVPPTEETPDTCSHKLATCVQLEDLSSGYTCHCLPDYMQQEDRCIAPLGATCLEDDGCITDFAECMTPPLTLPTTTTTVQPSRVGETPRELSQAPLGLWGHEGPEGARLGREILSKYREDILRSLQEVSGLPWRGKRCLCGAGYESNGIHCLATGAGVTIIPHSLIILLGILYITRNL